MINHIFCVKFSASDNTTSAEEVHKFGLLSSEWWKQSGNFDALKGMNKIRIPWIKNEILKDCKKDVVKPLDSFKILDVGCGGGLLSEVSYCATVFFLFVVLAHFILI